MIREVIDATLSMAGFRCVTASSASTAMEVMRRMRFDVAILDIHMPVISGLELLRWIRGRYSRLPVLIVSANRSVDTVREAMSLGCAGSVLGERYSLIATNVPFLGRGKQVDALKTHIERHDPDAKGCPCPGTRGMGKAGSSRRCHARPSLEPLFRGTS